MRIIVYYSILNYDRDYDTICDVHCIIYIQYVMYVLPLFLVCKSEIMCDCNKLCGELFCV